MTTRPSVLRALVLRPLRREVVRTLLTLAGIAVGVGVIIAIHLSNQSALRAFRDSVDAVAGRANLQIVPEAGLLDENLLLELKPFWERGVRFAPVLDLDATITSDDTPIRILAVDLLSDLHFRDYRYAKIATRSAPERTQSIGTYLELFGNDSVILPAPFARQRGLTLGSSINIAVGTEERPLIVRGLLKPEGPGTAFNGSIAIIDIAVAQHAFALTGKLSRIDLLVPENMAPGLVTLADPQAGLKNVSLVTADIERLLPPGTRIEPPSRRNERVGKMLRAFRVNLYALSGVALLVGVFLVYNTVLISVLRRRRDIGTVKTLGASSREITRAFLLEGALLGVSGSLLGIGIGYLLAQGTLDLIARTINALYVASDPTSVTLTPGACLLALVIGTGVSVAAALQPALEAAGASPSDLIRPGIYQPVSRSTSTRLANWSAILFLLSLAATQIPALNGISIGGYLSVILAVAAFSFVAPMLLTLLAHLFRRPLARWLGESGRLGAAAVPASLRRTSVATAALAIAIGMMVAIAIMVGSFRETVRVWVAQTVRSDLWLRPARALSNAPQASFPPSIAAELEKIDFIAAYDRINGRDLIFRDTLISLGSADFDVAADHGSLPMIAPLSAREALQQAVRRDGVLISESMSLKFDLQTGDRVELPVLRGMQSFPITGVYRDYSNDRGVVVMPRPLYERLYEDRSANTIAIFLKEGVSAEDARDILEKRLVRFRAHAVTNASIRREVMTIFDQTFSITYALLGIAIVVAVLGIINTLSALIIERRREIALLRTLGMTRGEIRQMVIAEAGIIGIAATILGAAAGYVLSLVLIFVINKQSFGWTIQLDAPVMVIGASLGTTLVATLLAGLAPARLAQQVDIARELKME